MKLRYFLPRADLRDFVRAYYLFEAPTGAAQPMAAELGNVRCLISGRGRFVMPDGSAEPFSPVTLIGPTMGAYRIEAEPGTRAFGVGVLPRGWRAFLGVGAEEIADSVIDFTALAGRAATTAGERIRAARSLPEMAAVADEYFAGLLARRARTVNGGYPEAFQRWLESPDDLDLDTLIEMMDVSRRQVDRIAKQVFGASPKVLQRKYRVLRAADRILFDGTADWMEAAGPSFYDQSHFIKEFRTFIGATPRQFALNRAALVSTVSAGRRSALLGRPDGAP